MHAHFGSSSSLRSLHRHPYYSCARWVTSSTSPISSSLLSSCSSCCLTPSTSSMSWKTTPRTSAEELGSLAKKELLYINSNTNDRRGIYFEKRKKKKHIFNTLRRSKKGNEASKEHLPRRLKTWFFQKKCYKKSWSNSDEKVRFEHREKEKEKEKKEKRKLSKKETKWEKSKNEKMKKLKKNETNIQKMRNLWIFLRF